MKGFWNRSGRADIESRLRDERPQPSEDFVSRTASTVPEATTRRRPQPRLRLGLAGAVTGAALTAAIVLGGALSPVGPIKQGLEQAGSSARGNDDKEKSKPANNQYENKVTIYHRAGKKDKGVTLRLSEQGANQHLSNHPDDTPGPCPGDS